MGTAFCDQLHVQSIDVALLVVIELERIARGDVELADNSRSIASALEDIGKSGVSKVGV